MRNERASLDMFMASLDQVGHRQAHIDTHSRSNTKSHSACNISEAEESGHQTVITMLCTEESCSYIFITEP